MAADCPYCQAAVPDASVDLQREIATCPSCARVIDLRARAAEQADTPSAGRVRPPVSLPAGMSITASNEGGQAGITITRRWLRTKHYVMLLVILAAAVGVAYGWGTSGYSTPLLLGTIFVTGWCFLLLGMFLNRTTIQVANGRVDVRHGPVPSPLGVGGKSVAAADLEQLFVVRHGKGFAVKAQLEGADDQVLVWPLASAEQGIFIEQQIERVLGLKDFEIAGEVGDGLPGAIPGPSGGIGALGIPIIIVGAIALFFFISASSLEGQLTAGEALGGWTFTPDDCRSGQLHGFRGVELMSSKDAGRRVRVIRDPVRGELVVVEQSGKITKLTAENCRGFQMGVRQTSTNINDVWVMEGRLSLDCDALSGEVQFAGCH